jgi:thiopeptide-type bacteriocin biosynthesis protein
MTDDWLQVNVALTRLDGSQASAIDSARALFASIDPLLEQWRRDDELECFFFQRKPPDVRLRFQGAGMSRGVSRGLSTVLDELSDRGWVDRWFVSVYEPEARKFGGRGACDAAHAHFDADTAAWVTFDRLVSAAPDADPLDSIRVAVALAEEMFRQVVGDPAEVWDVWCNLADLVGAAGAMPAPLPERLELGLLPEVVARLPLNVGAVVGSMATAAADLAARLDDEREGGRLGAGLRAILPFIAQYDLQRWGLAGEMQAGVALARAAALDPHRDLRGA